MKCEINLSEFTPSIIRCVIVVSPSANSLQAFHFCGHTWGFSSCFVVSELQGGQPKLWYPPRGIPAVWDKPQDMLLEAAFPSRNPFLSAFGCVRTQMWWEEAEGVPLGTR